LAGHSESALQSHDFAAGVIPREGLQFQHAGITGCFSSLGTSIAARTAQYFDRSASFGMLTFAIPIFVAILLMEMPKRHIRWMMLLWFLPLSGIASTLLFRYLFNAQYGLFQYLATEFLGLEPQPFLNSSDQVLFWLVFPGILFFGPGLIYMATLQGIPQSYYEAAEIEGAGFFRKIWTVSLPRLRPVISMMLIFAIIGTSQAFEYPLIMTGGGPGGASRTVVMYLYSLLQGLRYADATALGVYLFLVTMVLVIVFRRFFREDPDT
jgi:multiple sugar transport system permease protein